MSCVCGVKKKNYYVWTVLYFCTSVAAYSPCCLQLCIRSHTSGEENVPIFSIPTLVSPVVYHNVRYKFLSLSSFKIASAEPDIPVWLIVDVYNTCNRDVIWTTIHLSVRHKSYPNNNIPKRRKYLLTTNLTLEGKIGFVPHVDYYSLVLLASTMCFVAAVLFSLWPTCTTYKTVLKMTCVLKE